MLNNVGGNKQAKRLGAFFCCTFTFTVLAGSIALVAQSGLSLQPGPLGDKAGMSVTTEDPWGNPCDVMMDNMKGMIVMGQSMVAVTNHMCISPPRLRHKTGTFTVWRITEASLQEDADVSIHGTSQRVACLSLYRRWHIDFPV